MQTQTKTKKTTQTKTKTNNRIRYKKSIHKQDLDEISNSVHVMYTKYPGYVMNLYAVTIRKILVDYKYRDVIYLHTNEKCIFIYLDTIRNNFISKIFDYPSTRNLDLKIIIDQITDTDKLIYEIDIIN